MFMGKAVRLLLSTIRYKWLYKHIFDCTLRFIFLVALCVMGCVRAGEGIHVVGLTELQRRQGLLREARLDTLERIDFGDGAIVYRAVENISNAVVCVRSSYPKRYYGKCRFQGEAKARDLHWRVASSRFRAYEKLYRKLYAS